MNERQIHTVIISDSEGSPEHYLDSLQMAKCILSEYGVAHHRVAFLGDASDKGYGSLFIIHDLLNQPDAILIVGNRDANKGRFLELFSKRFVDSFGEGLFNFRIRGPRKRDHTASNHEGLLCFSLSFRAEL